MEEEAAGAASTACETAQSSQGVPHADKPGTRSSVGKRPPVPAPGKVAHIARAADEDEAPPVWGAIAFALTIIGWFQGAVIGVRAVSISLAALGAVIALVGFVVTRGACSRRETTWLKVGGGASALLLLVLLVAPSLLNRRWAIDFEVPAPDLQAQVVVPRGSPLAQGHPHKADEWADAVKEAVRQHEVLARIDGVRTDVLPNRPSKKVLLVHVRVANSGRGEQVVFEGFDKHKNVPKLKDSAGRDYEFLEQRPRRYTAGGPIEFESAAWTPRPLKIMTDVELVFAAPPPRSAPYRLELPASAWEREGSCRLLLPESFQYSVDP